MNGEITFPFETAMANLAARPSARWPNIAAEFGADVLPDLDPSFQFTAGETVFTIGSCFARAIEAHLARLGCRVPMLDFNLPPHEWHGPSNQALNKFSPPSFRQALEWAAAIDGRDGRVGWSDCEPFAFDMGDGCFLDLDLRALTGVSRERFIARRQEVFEVLRTAFSAGCVLMTPGLIEVWRDRRTGLFTAGAVPKVEALKAAGDRFELALLDYERCLQDLDAAIDLVRERNRGCRFLVTTSPVPMAATFTGQDVRVANTYAKSVLRAVCGAVALSRPDVDYFPSYESVILSDPGRTWRPDRIHVEDAIIGRVIGRMAEAYFTGIDPGVARGQSAAAALAAGDLEAAERDARAVLAADPDDGMARTVLIDALIRRGGLQDEVINEIGSLPAELRETAAVRLRLAQAVFARDQEAGAALGLQACALPDADRRAFVWTDKAMAAVRRPAAEREEMLRKGIGRLPFQPHLRGALARLLEKQGRVEDAVAELQVAVTLPFPKPEHQADLERLLATSQQGADEDGRA